MNRRDVLKVSGLAAFAGFSYSAAKAAGFAISEAYAAPSPITHVRFDLNRIHKWDSSNGDTWDPFWADDDRLYAFNCDGRGFGKEGRNLAFNVFTGSQFDSLIGSQVDSMDEYGKSGEKRDDNATWKVCGQECIDGIFYAFVSRNVYGKESDDPLLRQTAFNSSLIKSTDRGRTWIRTADENYARPMWAGPAFGAPMFVHYGKNGGHTTIDGADEFVYAASTNGFWCDGDFLVLGRVRRDRIGRLDSSDWQYWRGGANSSVSSWTASVYEAHPILARPAKCGQTPITYVPSLGVYLLISWYNPDVLPKWYKPTEMRYDLHSAPHPWGPWAQIGSLDDKFLQPGYNMYGPSICAKYQESGPDGVTVRMFTAGCQFEDIPGGIYKVWSMPVVLETKSQPASTYFKVENAGFEKHGDWRVLGEDPGRENQAWTTSQTGNALTLDFEGSAIEVIARKAAGYGALEISVDNNEPTKVVLATTNFPELSDVSVFQARHLSSGHHRLGISNASGAVNVQGVRISA